MATYLQYFNCEKMGRYPNGADALDRKAEPLKQPANQGPALELIP